MSLSPEQEQLIGEVLADQYRITRKLAEGGMGVVFEAVHTRLGKKKFAVKVLHGAIRAHKEVYARFRREAEIATELGHRNIVEVLDFNETSDGSPYMVMEFLEGEDLSAMLSREGRLKPEELLEIIDPVAHALAAAHAKEIVHRDLKPENIFLALDSEGDVTVKVLDFGISKIKHSKSVVTQDSAVMGTPFYMSPEQAVGQVKQIDHRTDIFALGTICYQALAGVLPFDAPTIPGVIYKICHEEPPAISEQVSDLPDGVEAVLARAMAKELEHRYDSVGRFVAEFKAAVNGEPVAAPPPRRARSVPKTVKHPRLSATDIATAPTTLSGATAEVDSAPQNRRRAPLVVGILGTLVLAAGIAFWATSGDAVEPVSTPVRRAAGPVAGRPAGAAPGVEQQAPPRVTVDQGSAASKATAEQPRQVKITLALSPPGARWTLDGAPGKQNPILLRPTAATRRLRVVAHGYHTGVELFVADKDRTLTIKLRKKRRKKKRGPASATKERPAAGGGKQAKPVGEGTMDWTE